MGIYSALTAVLWVGLVQAASNPVVARIGSQTLSMRELELRKSQQGIQGPHSLKTAYKQMHRALLGAEILRKYGRPVSTDVLRSEYDRMKKNSLMPEKLAEHRSAFASESDFLKLYVLPVFVGRVLYFDFFSNERQFHEKAYAEANRIMQASMSQPLNTVLRGSDLRVTEVKLTEEGIVPLKLPGALGTARDGVGRSSTPDSVPVNVAERLKVAPSQEASQLKQWVAQRKAGDWLPIVPKQTHLMLLKIKSTGGDQVLLELVTVPKTPFEVWLGKESKQIAQTCNQASICGG